MKEKTPAVSKRIVRLKELINITGLSRSTIYEKQNPKSPNFDAEFPRKINLGARAVGWISLDVQAWLNTVGTQSLSGEHHKPILQTNPSFGRNL